MTTSKKSSSLFPTTESIYRKYIQKVYPELRALSFELLRLAELFAMYRPRNEEPEKKKRSRASYRNIDNLFSESVTVHCALEGRCVPCAYKIGNFDVALDDDFTRAVPNQRPEMCPRAKGGVRCPRLGTLGFRRGMNILTVGDGDFSFSVAVLRLLYHKGSLDGQIVATSYEDRQTLERVYPNVRKHLDELERCGADILFEVDATKLRESSVTANDAARRFDRIVWNFPCTAIESGKDGQNDEMDANKELVGMFVSEARHMLLDVSGEILMCHKTKPPFNQWNFAEVAIKESNDEDPVVEYRGRVVLDRFTLPPYTPEKLSTESRSPVTMPATMSSALPVAMKGTHRQYRSSAGLGSLLRYRASLRN